MAADDQERSKRSPERAFIGIWTAIGVGFGVALGLVFDNLVIGLAVGAAVGASIGTSLYSVSTSPSVTSGMKERMVLVFLIILGLLMLVTGAIMAIVSFG